MEITRDILAQPQRGDFVISEGFGYPFEVIEVRENQVCRWSDADGFITFLAAEVFVLKTSASAARNRPEELRA